jgi:nucleotide-binding universal stress UspA family protein
MLSWKKILCPVDFSETSHAALHVAVDLATKIGASIELLNVVALPAATVPEIPVPGAEVVGAIVAGSRQSLDAWKREAEQLGAPAVDTVQALGTTAESILGRAHTTECGVIVMGTHGRGFIKRAILGSVAEQVLRRSPCPVIAVGPEAAAREERKAS